MSNYLLKNKLITLDKVVEYVGDLKKEGKTVVFTNGCFDIIHKGHIDYLRKSRLLGDCLIIGLNSDDSIKILKGNSRPINQAHDRAFVLEAMDFVDYIVIFDEGTPLELIKHIKPNVYTKGGDYDLDNIIGYGIGKNIIENYGGEVRLIPLVSDISTTAIIGRT